MKFLATLLICCIVLLSSFSGMVKPVSSMPETDCCAKTAKKHCEKSHKKTVKDTCEKQGCNMMLTCSICGFLMVEPTRVNAASVLFIENPIPTYKSGNSAAYLPSDWKPPKV